MQTLSIRPLNWWVAPLMTPRVASLPPMLTGTVRLAGDTTPIGPVAVLRRLVATPSSHRVTTIVTWSSCRRQRTRYQAPGTGWTDDVTATAPSEPFTRQ